MDSEKINRLIAENNLEKALAYIDEWLSNHSKDDKAYYLKGLVFWKQGNWKLTIENYLKAIEINPDSPAKQAYEMVMNRLATVTEILPSAPSGYRSTA